MMRPAMIRPNRIMPNTIGVIRPVFAMIQPIFSEIAAATRITHRTTKNAIAFCRRVTNVILATVVRLEAGHYDRQRRTALSDGFVGGFAEPVGNRGIRERFLDLRDLDVPREAEELERPDADPVLIELVPRQAMPRAGGVC